MPTKAKKTTPKDLDKIEACIHLKTLNSVSNSLQPLCECVKRDLILGKMAVICSVCDFFKKTNNTVSDLYIADELGDDDLLWNEEDFYDVIKEREDTDDFDFEESQELFTDEDEEDEEEEDEKPKRKRKKKSKKKEEEEEDDEDIVIEKETEEEEKISEELFGGTDEEEEKELEVEDETVEVEKEFQEKQRKIKDEEQINDDDFIIDAIKSGGKDNDGSNDDDIEDEGFDTPEIEITPDGKERCPYCQKEFGSVSRHISRCKRAPPGAAEAIRKKMKKSKKSTKKSTKKNKK